MVVTDMPAASTVPEDLRSPIRVPAPSTKGVKRSTPLHPDAATLHSAPPFQRRRRDGVYESALEARRRSHALASVRPVRLDELLATHSELRRLNVCIRGLPDKQDESEDELASEMSELLRDLLDDDSPGVTYRDVYRVGRYSTSRPRPVIVECADLKSKLVVLRAKSMLYAHESPEELKMIRIYHDLSPL